MRAVWKLLYCEGIALKMQKSKELAFFRSIGAIIIIPRSFADREMAFVGTAATRFGNVLKMRNILF